MVLTAYGRSTGFYIDPVEKKPLHHFLPGSKVLSFGTAGCNLGCLFCQNWSISKARELDRLSAVAFSRKRSPTPRKSWDARASRSLTTILSSFWNMPSILQKRAMKLE
jgi:pyruvate formate lyase activating enzyme